MYVCICIHTYIFFIVNKVGEILVQSPCGMKVLARGRGQHGRRLPRDLLSGDEAKLSFCGCCYGKLSVYFWSSHAFNISWLFMCLLFVCFLWAGCVVAVP